MVANHSNGPANGSSDARSQVLAAATRLFAARGFDGTPLQAIADELGVTKAAVLHHFPSKEALRAAVLAGILAHWQETLPSLLLAATASEDRFDAVFGELHRFFSDDTDRARLLVREALDRPQEIRALLSGPVRPWLTAVARYIRGGQNRGDHFADVDAEAYLVHMIMMVVAAAGMSGVYAAAIDAPDAGARFTDELKRIARSSLFRPAPPSRPTRSEKPRR